MLGWDRNTIRKGRGELASGPIIDNFRQEVVKNQSIIYPTYSQIYRKFLSQNAKPIQRFTPKDFTLD
jgi:hypothetical protein